ALALGSMTYGLSVEVGETLPDAGGALLARLSRIEESLDAAASTLAGEGNGGAPHTAPATTAPRTPPPSHRARHARSPLPRAPLASYRAHLGSPQGRRTPHQVSAFLDLVTAARARAALSGPSARELKRRGRLLRRGTNMLKAELGRLASQ